jgi:DNA polymerase-1
MLSKRFLIFEDYVNKQKSENINFEFNINSDKQLKELLIERMKLPVIEQTKKGNPSVNADVLEEYAKKNKFCFDISKYRSLCHLKSTFLDGMKARLEDGKIHTDYLLFSTVTGRLSSRNPNLNNIPRTSTASDIKDIFCSDRYSDGTSDWLIEVDQGQCEFRFLIQYSKDPQALEDLNEGIDVHKLIGASAWHGIMLPRGHISYEQFKEMTKDVTKDERQDTKQVIFGIMFGRGAKSVAEQLGITVAMAQRIINLFFDRYKVSKKWLDITVAEARRDGYVNSFFGRKRRLLNIKSSNDGLRSEAERQAVNSPIQGAASDLTFLSAINIYDKDVNTNSLKSRLVLTVYDSLVFNVPDNELEFMAKSMFNRMSEQPKGFIVPLVPDIKIGKTWGSLMEVDLKEDWNIIQEKLNQKFIYKNGEA